VDDSTTAGVAGAGIFGFFCLFYIVLLVLVLAAKIFWIIMIIDVARREFPEQNTKLVWLLVVIFGSFIGALVYNFVGKPQGRLPAR
jgi:Phospholipase_D-nuclease N-terminal